MIRHKLVINGNPGLFVDSSSIASFSSKAMVNRSTELTIGSVCAAMIEVEIRRKDGLTIPKHGDKIDLYEADGNSPFQKHGVYNVEESVQSSKEAYRITAYDNVILLSKDVSEWLNAEREWPISLYDMARSVAAECGLTLANSSIPNGSYMVRKFSGTDVDARQIYKWIGEASGQFCRADSEGRISFGWYMDSGVSLSPSDYYAGRFVRKPYSTDRVDAVRIMSTPSDVGTAFPVPGPDATSGPSNAYEIVGNYLLTAESSDSLVPVAESIFNRLKNISYTPATVSIPATFRLSAGDIIRVSDADGNSHIVYVMSKTQSGSRDTISCTGSQNRHTATRKSGSTFQQLQGKYLELEESIDGVRIEAGNAVEIAGKSEKRIAELELTADGLSSTVDRQEKDAETLRQQVSQISQDAESVKISIQKIETDGVEKVRTANDYTFDADGMHIQRSGSALSNRIDHTGMHVDQGATSVLAADHRGVDATNLHARTHLIIGDNSRMEDYGLTGGALFWLGG